ncbi:hypothetical protein [Peribacillus frigoritolerans]|uniref:GntT/GntP/DsdX family permease n=1 Tax=Peribacillus frigoritolerans TaxID=450367 RepID=UPI0032E37A60
MLFSLRARFYGFLSFPDLRCLVFLIIILAKVKWHPCIALLLASVVLGNIARMDIPDVADAVQTGAGNNFG